MKALRSTLVVLSSMLLCAAISAASTPASVETGISATSVNSPAPVPICPPEEGWCETLPGNPPPHVVNSPAPVPICPPEEGWCETLPGNPPPHVNLNSQDTAR